MIMYYSVTTWLNPGMEINLDWDKQNLNQNYSLIHMDSEQ
jgi:hypothetical protein